MTDTINRTAINRNLINARCKLITEKAFYGTMASMMTWRESLGVPTMGVSMASGGRINASYNPHFCSSLTIDGLMAVIWHEIEHVCRMHLLRFGTGRSQLVWGFACDMVINGHKSNPKIPNLPNIVDKDGKEVGGPLYMPKDWSADMTTEETYNKLMENVKNITCPCCGGKGTVGTGPRQQQDQDDEKDNQEGNSGEGNGKGGDQSQEVPCPMCQGGQAGDQLIDNLLGNGTWLDDHREWEKTTANEDEARQYVRHMIQSASRMAGDTPGHMVSLLEDLRKPLVNWKHMLRAEIGRKAGGKRWTYARANRRHDRFGVKGKSSHARTPLIIWVDTSGSMTMDDLSVVFTEIEAISQHFSIWVGQFDQVVQGKPEKYHRGDWKNIELKGRGGTSFETVLLWAKENGAVAQVNLVLTDGYANFGENPGFPVIWGIVNNDERVEPPYGDVVRIVNHR